jgi:hypothetical protein
MSDKKYPILLVCTTILAFYASSSGYADKTFIPKESQQSSAAVSTDQLIESSVEESPEAQAPSTPSNEPKTEAPSSPVDEPETEKIPNHPKRYVR